MDSHRVAVACISETHIYGKDPSKLVPNGIYYWIPGPELLPAFGDRKNRPRRGLGMLVNRSLLPDGAVIKTFEHSFWARFPSRSPGAKPLFVCCTHLHVAKHHLRAAVWSEIHAGIALFKGLGSLIIGGDFHSRCALNGDKVLDSTGRELLDFANEHQLTVVNGLDGVASGEFTRIQRRERAHSSMHTHTHTHTHAHMHTHAGGVGRYFSSVPWR